MNTLTLAIFACLAVLAAARPHDDGQWHGDGHGHWGGWDDGQWHGDGHGHWGGWDDGQWHGDGHWDDGSWDDGHWDGAWDGAWGGAHSDVVVGPGATIVGPAAHGHGWGHGWAGAHVGHGHGVVVGGPHTVPATIVGPAGKVVADGLYGVGHGHGHGHHW